MVADEVSACWWWMLVLLAVGTTVKSQGQGIIILGIHWLASYIAICNNFYLVPTYL